MSVCNQCIIKEFNTLKSLSSNELKQIAKHKTSTRFKKGEVLFKEGNLLNGVYCIKNGACKLTKRSENGNEQIVKFIKIGDMLGYRSVLSGEPVSLTVTAVKDMEACFIPKEKIFEALKNNPKFSLDMIKTICSDLRDANAHLTNMAQKNSKQRLADRLLFLRKTFGEDAEGFINIDLSREEFSNIIGTALESAIRLLSEFKKKGYIETRGKQIKLIDLAGLEQLVKGF
ncbi:Crp/Fnr family transcriptional regulator [Flavobacteriaceae bacterium F08102]|nr:Crp/Fnr family transcriptional regulator [Flavobacteriaceae bacterium F08102]